MYISNRIVGFVFFLFLVCTSAQDKKEYDFKAEYFLKFKLNTDVKTQYKEYFTLYFNEKESLFLSNKIIDYAKIKDGVSEVINMEKIRAKSTIFKEIVVKKNNALTSFLKYDSQYFYYLERSPNWALIDEEKKIGYLVCKKASTSFLGRRWTAWYTEEYSFPFGVFKFNGLPGLIIELYDDDETYHYSLVNIKKNKDFDIIKKVYPKLTAKQLSKKEFFKIYDNLLYNNKLLYGDKYSFLLKNLSADQIKKVKDKYDEIRRKRNNFPIDKDIKQ